MAGALVEARDMLRMSVSLCSSRLNQTGHGPDRLATMQGYFFAVTQCGSTGPKKRSATCLARGAVVWRKEIAVDQIMHWQFLSVNNSLRA